MSHTLFVSLGTSPAVVAEAFLLPGFRFDVVHVLTTETPDVSAVRAFFSGRTPSVRLELARVAGFRDFRDERDHFAFEEVLFRWILAGEPDPARRVVCLSGGFKTMSAALQRAAAVLGAAEVFHVLADACVAEPTPGGGSRQRMPSSAAEISNAAAAGNLHWIRLGAEAGWPQFRTTPSSDFPLNREPAADGATRLASPDSAFRDRLDAVIARSHNIARAWENIDALPFSALATLPASTLDWLRQPLDPVADAAWVGALPKVELHCHLGGFATHGVALEAVRRRAQEPDLLPALIDRTPPPGWPETPRPIGLEAYRKLGDNNGSALLRDPGCLRAQCRLLYAHFIEQHVVYAEIRCSPANYADPDRGRSPWDVLADIRAAFDEAMALDREETGSAAPRCHVNLLVIGTRQDRGDFRAGISRHLALALAATEHDARTDACRVVGVDLAGYEDTTTRAHYFREEFSGVHRCGLALTVHAGENDDAEGVWRAVFDLNARRLGHALTLRDSPELLRAVVDRQIGIEMCPWANLQIRGFPVDAAAAAAPASARYPLLSYLRAGARVCVNTDNIGISAASLTDNLLLAARLCPGLTRLDVIQLQRHALDAAFLPALLRKAVVTRYSSGMAASLSLPDTNHRRSAS